MFRFFKSRKPATPPFDYVRAWQRLCNQYADPAIELAQTKQAIIVSAASVIDRLWNGHGGGGWDESCEEDYIAPLREHLVPDKMFSENERAEISRKLDEIVAVGRENLRRIAEAAGEETTLESSVDADFIVARATEWCMRHPEPI